MRYVAPTRGSVDPLVFDRLPLAAWGDYTALLRGEAWPSIAAINGYLPTDATHRFVPQTAALLADGLHYEKRIAELRRVFRALGRAERTRVCQGRESSRCARAPRGAWSRDP